MEMTTSAAGVTWDLGDLFASHDDPALAATLEQAEADARAFAETYRGTIQCEGGPDAAHLRSGLERLEAIYDAAARPLIYANLLFASDTSKPAHQNLQQQVEQRYTAINNLVLFFDLEWLALSDADAQRLIDDPHLQPYRHYLMNQRRYQPHTLSEPEERVINEKDLTGAHAWKRLFTELIGALRFPVERDGEQQQLPLDAVLMLLRNPQRSLRQHAFTSLFDTLRGQTPTLTYIYNTLIQDHLIMDTMRHYPDPMLPMHLYNEMDPDVIATMMEVVEQNYAIAHRYFRLKARLLQLPRLQIYDQYAPISQSAIRYTYPEARDVILHAFGSFDTRFRDTAARFFERNWIDAEVRPGKRSGAFCNGYPPSNHPYILCSYTDDLHDAMTVAHELGHGIHACFSNQQTLLNFSPSLPMAETASVFAELLVFEHLMAQQSDDQARLMLLCSKIEDIFATIFRQNVFTRFEQATFAARAQGRLGAEQISAFWSEANGRYYGDAFEQTKGYELGWSYIPHFINTPFYCYSYIFGELLVLALYAMYREEGRSFIPRYTALLEAGGSAAPATLLTSMGVNIHDAAFWQRGFHELQRLVDWAHELGAQQ
jgi:oligoendopeptidase F